MVGERVRDAAGVRVRVRVRVRFEVGAYKVQTEG